MKFIPTSLLVLIMMFGPVGAHAVPYYLSFDGSSVGPRGIGSFDWNPITSIMTSLSWNFGSGRIGGMSDYFLAHDITSSSFNARTVGEFIFESIFFSSRNPAFNGSSSGGGDIHGTFLSDIYGEAYYCWGLQNHDECGMPNGGNTTYEFTRYRMDGSFNVVARGNLSVSENPFPTVPEPSPLALLCLGLMIMRGRDLKNFPAHRKVYRLARAVFAISLLE